ncbi:3'(2'),5'-bisphosphate nucleotidase CysQ [Flagellimonas meridianipacifica]|uniref:3'(2'),5'-bisphosphate nucleotidase CysQ n=1 Tax=Flagellimonas meridianipacifica TaxID=1080225 RepID=A0A2T0MCR2_9FLAO|nr:3'(2'),5'-bisphosphate nucleotidase CysQ [Allomuricauda pacifica]PRX55287.1 3'(2'), 5'-bisphosphate nucleotidase [Allomuricauda pacifica]
MQSLSESLEIAINAAILGGLAIMEVYSKPNFNLEIKDNNSPLTEADTAANTIINEHLIKTRIPIISEENKNLDYVDRKKWDSCWIVDPLDGTKEFIKRNGEFTVNIALCQKGRPILGVIYVPVTRELYYADVSRMMAFKTVLNEEHLLANDLYADEDRITKNETKKELVRVVGSRSHMNQDTLDYISSIENDFDSVEIVSKGSSLKFCLVAEGKADVYPRFAPTMEWDTAAGHAICNAVGLKVVSQLTNEELPYNKENLLNPYFLVSS